MRSSMDNFFARQKRYAARVTQIISHYEKVILALLAVVIVISGTFWYRQFAQNQGTATAGGSYVEGLVGTERDVQQIATRLTKTGLFTINNDGELENVLVQDWRVNPEKTEYFFKLLKEVSKNEILTELQNSLELLGPASVELTDGDEIAIKTTKANPNIPLLLTQPLFDYGPYKLNKATGKTTIFSRNPREGAVRPYLNKVIVHTYADKALLQQALDKGKVDGAENENLTVPEGYHLQSFELSKYYAVIFNINKSPFRDGAMRRALIDESTVANSPFTLTAADQEPYKGLAEELVKRWQALGAQVTLELKPLDEIQDKAGPSRQFQALLTGIDYGAEMDPTYLWHSSQIRPPGNNFSGINNDGIDVQIDTLRQLTNVAERTAAIKSLHEALQREGVAKFLKQESVSFIAEDTIAVQKPWLAQNASDRYRSIADWYVK
ncbi:MAG: hypothetical protein HZB70_02100 [Candidatus Berkelbacteria bacterium]|nr:MAG: hypothetical protein HZB70_02100 [Candidatus Berkelbacteria bacterium]QQG51889.1 MAG: hypothetical protein HY845_00895 [Candidatus Berkelbacteria bacterium]